MEVSVQENAFDAGAELNNFTKNTYQTGAITSFTGLVRDYRQNPDGSISKLHAMQLQHYPGMSQRLLQELVAKAKERFALNHVKLIHRYGLLQPNEAIVLVMTASAHRIAAFEGCMFLMDCLKTDAPFWKCEYDTNGNAQWVSAKQDDSQQSDRWK